MRYVQYDASDVGIPEEVQEEERELTVRDLMGFFGETDIRMDTRIRIAGGKEGGRRLYTMTYTPVGNILYLDESKYKKG